MNKIQLYKTSKIIKSYAHGGYISTIDYIQYVIKIDMEFDGANHP